VPGHKEQSYLRSALADKPPVAPMRDRHDFRSQLVFPADSGERVGGAGGGDEVAAGISHDLADVFQRDIDRRIFK